MVSLNAADIFRKGLDALYRGQIYLAQRCFEQAVTMERSPSHCSWLAYVIAKTRSDFAAARALLAEALSMEPSNPVHYLNLGRVHMLAGERQAAIVAWRDGLCYAEEPEIIEELERLGTRKPPVFGWLSRSNPLNKYSGLLLSRMGLR
jgi:tetratricopeptide (TPR) repeat protein